MLLGVVLVILSSLYTSSFLAIFGLAILSWSAILLYITPEKHVTLTLLNSVTADSSSNSERMLKMLKLTEKGVYLPPKNLTTMQSSLVFIPKTPETKILNQNDVGESFSDDENAGAYFTPPGFSLSKLFEQAIGKSFINTDLNDLQNDLSKVIVNELGIADEFEVQEEKNFVEIKIKNSIFAAICQQTETQTHHQIGCLLSSALACALAKSTGKSIIIQNECFMTNTKTTVITYKVGDE